MDQILTFVCADSGKLKIKDVPLDKLSRLKNPRVIESTHGLELHAEFKYRSGVWRLSEMASIPVYPPEWRPILSRLVDRIKAS